MSTVTRVIDGDGDGDGDEDEDGDGGGDSDELANAVSGSSNKPPTTA